MRELVSEFLIHIIEFSFNNCINCRGLLVFVYLPHQSVPPPPLLDELLYDELE